MFKKENIAIQLKSALLLLVMFISIGFIERQNGETECAEIKVKIKNTSENYFLSKEAVVDLITLRGKQPLVGDKLIHIALKDLEKRLKKSKFVKTVQITKNLKGTLLVNVTQRRPIARFLCADTSYYLGSEGNTLPLSNRYSARVLLVSGKGASNYFQEDSVKTEADNQLFDLLNYVYKNRFLRAQISEISVSNKGELIMYPQVTKQPIVFGTCENHVDKFKKLNVFYHRILPEKGWNKLDTVNLKYKDQIICK